MNAIQKIPLLIWQRALLFAVAFFVCAEASAALTVAGGKSASLWLPAGLVVAVLLLNRTRDWPVLLLAVLPVNFFFDLAHGTSPALAIAFYCANTVQAVTGAWLIRRFVAEKPALATLNEFLGLLVFGGMFGPVVGGVIGAGALVALGASDSFVQSWKVWWGSSMIAVLVLSPFILAWFHFNETRARAVTAGRIAEAVLIFLALAAATGAVLANDHGIMSPYKAVVIPFLLWAALRFGTRGATAACLFLVLVFSYFTTQRHTGVTPAQVASGEYIFVMHLVMTMTMTLALIPAIVLGERDRTMARLRENEVLFRTAFENSSAGVCLVAEDGKFLKVNHTLCQMLGYAREELEKLSLNDITHPEDRHVGDTLTVPKQPGAAKEARAEKRYLHKDGHTVWVEVLAAGVEATESHEPYSVCYIRDITERKHAAEALQESEKRFASAFEYSAIGMALVAPDGRFLKVNQSLCKMLGYEVNELCAKTFQDITYAEDLERDLDYVRKMLANEIETYQMEKRYLHRGGHLVWILLTVSLVKDEQGTPRHFISQIQDITERKQAERSLQETKEQLQYIIDNTKDVIFQIDLRGNYIYGNAAAERLTGYTLPELMQMNMMQLVAPEHHVLIKDRMQRRLQGTVEETAFEIEFRHKSGHRVWTELTTSEVYDQDHRLIAIQGVARDVTERRQLADQLRHSQKMEAIGQLSGGVAHDFNNILAAMMMQAEFSAAVENTPKEVREGLQQIRVAAERAANLTRQLLLFSRKQVMQARNLDLNDVVTNLAKMLQRLIGADIRMQLHLHPAPLVILADAGMLDQMLLNLAVNARDAMVHGGTLLIETTEIEAGKDFDGLEPGMATGRYVRLRVSDTGTGIPREILPRIFEPFFTTKAPGKGTGLGLATVFGIVKQHHGFIKVKSEPGLGADFHIFLPVSNLTPESLVSTAAPALRRGTETILFVEDEKAVRSITRVLLERSGYHVLEAENGVEAIKLWDKQRDGIDLLLTDLLMPGGVSGHELASRLRKDRPELKVVFISGYSGEIAGRQIELKVGERFLQKPMASEKLMETIRLCLDD